MPAPFPALRFSLPGVQPKLSATMSASDRLTIPAGGVGGSWIVKFPSAAFPGLPEQEHAMMTLAGRVGIDVPQTRLVSVDSIENLPRGMGLRRGQALAVRRFDRMDDGTRVHVEDFAQVLGAHPEQKYVKAGYRDIVEVIGREVGDDAVAEFIRRLVFCVLIGNGDAHLKNWALIYPDRCALLRSRPRTTLFPPCRTSTTTEWRSAGSTRYTGSAICRRSCSRAWPRRRGCRGSRW